jgi:uncharacterized protein (TIGR02271 family)
MNEEPIVVVDKAGQRGLVDPSQFRQGNGSVVLLRFPDRQVWAPPELLEAQDDGVYYLPVTVAELVAQTGSSGQTGSILVAPVIEEELRVRKLQVESGVRVTKVVHEKQETFDLPLVSEEIEVRRVPINRPIDQPVGIRYEENAVVIPLFEEVLVVQKQLLLKEEVHIVTKRTETRRSGQETLRREEVLVEPVAGNGPHRASPQDAYPETDEKKANIERRD